MGARSSHPRSPNLNKTDGHLIEYFRNAFIEGGGGTNFTPQQGLQATGGVISEYTDGSTIYRAHIFNTSGSFVVSELGNFDNTVDCLIVAGGGGGGFAINYAGSGGGGGIDVTVWGGGWCWR